MSRVSKRSASVKKLHSVKAFERIDLRKEFERRIFSWTAMRPEEAKRLASMLSGWMSTAFEDSTRTLWELIEERLKALAHKKNELSLIKQFENIVRTDGGSDLAELASETPVTVMDSLFKAPTADEWMARFKLRI